MFRITVLYPATPSYRFDFDYYLQQHMPLSIRLLSAHPGYRGTSVERGVAGAEPGAAAPYVALCHFTFEQVEDFMAAFLPHAPTLQGDIINYTDITPVIQISQVALTG